MNDKEEPAIIREKHYGIKKKKKDAECSQCSNNLEELEEQKEGLCG